MQPKVKILIAACAVIAITVTAFFIVKQPARTARRELEAKLARETKAFEARDLKTLLDGLAPNATATDLRGKVRAYPYIKSNYQRAFSSFDTIEASARIESLHIDSDKATEDVTQTITGTIRDSRNHSHVVKNASRARIHLTRMPQGWKIVSSQVLEETVSLDGKATRLER